MKRAYFLCAYYGIFAQTLDHLDIGRQTRPILPYVSVMRFLTENARRDRNRLGTRRSAALRRFCFSRGRTS